MEMLTSRTTVRTRGVALTNLCIQLLLGFGGVADRKEHDLATSRTRSPGLPDWAKASSILGEPRELPHSILLAARCAASLLNTLARTFSLNVNNRGGEKVDRGQPLRRAGRPFTPMIPVPCVGGCSSASLRPPGSLSGSYLAPLSEEIIQDNDGQSLDPAEVGVVGDEERAAGPKSRCSVESVWCLQAGLGAQAGGFSNT